MNERDPAEQQRLAALAAYSGDPWTPQNPYFAAAEEHAPALWENLIWPFIHDCDFSAVLDLAAGHGRNSVFLLRHAGHLTVSDIQAGNVEACRRRLGESARVDYLVGNGYDFAPIGAGALTLVYCFDAMVHFDSDVVRSYLRDARRVLARGGRAFFHHSNYVGGHDWRTNPNARNFMSRELFAHYALKEGLAVVRQKTINWGTVVDSDCLSLLERPAA